MTMFRAFLKVRDMPFLRSVVGAKLLLLALSLPGQANEVFLTKDDLVEVRPGIWAAPALALPRVNDALPIVGAENSEDGVRLLRLYSAQGRINGFDGILYDNRDRGHSVLPSGAYPRLTHLRYSQELMDQGLDFGPAGRILFPAVVIGNSSTAIRSGPAPRSLPRLAMTTEIGHVTAPLLYENNHIYIYPEHRDHDLEDRFPANWPYLIASQGSSGSDLRILNGAALTLAALPSDTFEFMKENGLVASTFQMILRRNLATVSTRDEYLSGLAHPTVFDGREMRSGRMVAQAAELRPQDVPPMVRIRVIDENFSDSAGLAALSERFLDTPGAIARLWRSFAWERELLVTAEDTTAPNDKPLTFEWRLLRGDPERVWIEPQAPDGRKARIRIAWHDPWAEQYPDKKGTKERRVSRVDIGVFAFNGVHDSAPAIISVDFPKHQVRKYSSRADEAHRLLSIDYDAGSRGTYIDPVLYWSAEWTDLARYDDDGKLTGWERKGADGVDLGLVALDAGDGSPRYQIDRSQARMPMLRIERD